MTKSSLIPTSTHWGNFLIESDGIKINAVHAYDTDQHPSLIGQSLLHALDPKTRVCRPAVRESYLENRWGSAGSLRGREPFVEVDWDVALDLAAEALRHTKITYSNEAIYGGSYGWASAGRFHHANSQLHRFLNTIGGFVSSRDTYSVSAGARILPHAIGMNSNEIMVQAPGCEEMEQHTELLVCFGGLALKNSEVNHGGIGDHYAKTQIKRLNNGRIEVINISPIKDDMSEELGAKWWPVVPQTDTALMLGLAHTLEAENLVNQGFIERYTTGYPKFRSYLMGEDDGVKKDADWAARISQIPAKRIRELAHRMATKRTIISASLSLQRAEHGEQPWWMMVVLSAMIGDIGLPGGGPVFGYGSIHSYGHYGRNPVNFKVGSFRQGKNPVDTFIPVARIADMLLHPGEKIDYDGRKVTYPDIKLIYWAGGNPFHHHQDINRLRKAWARPETIIVNEIFWTAAARNADIVFPVTTTLERNDFSMSVIDTWISPMRKAVANHGESRNDFDVFSGIAERMGCADAFTEGKSEIEWVESLYNQTIENAHAAGVSLPEFSKFWSGQQINLADQLSSVDFSFEKFRRDPDTHPLKTPSGQIEIFSETIAEFEYDDCCGHPKWYEKQEWLGAKQSEKYLYHMISNQPKGKLHSQFDHGVASTNLKTKKRTTLTMNDLDAAELGVRDGDVVRVYNDRGACIAGVKLSANIRPHVVELPTGAWYDPENLRQDGSVCVHGNPNVLTLDAGTSKLAQGPSAHSCLVGIEKYTGVLPPIKIFDLPDLVKTR